MPAAMRRLTAIALMAALSSGAFAQEALWGKAPVVSPEIHADGTVTFRIEAYALHLFYGHTFFRIIEF